MELLIQIKHKCLSLRKKVGVKLYDIFLETEWLERFLSKILPLDFSEILNIFEITQHSKYQLILGCDVIKVLKS